MKLFKRGMITIQRQWMKSFLLFLIVFILGLMLTGTTMIRNAILQTEHNLFSSMPRVATINLDFDTLMEIQREANEIGDASILEQSGTNPETIKEIGRLPYVETFNYSFVHNLWNSELYKYGEFSESDDDPPFWNVFGLYNSNLLDLEEGVIEIVDGRPFLESDMQGTGAVALISKELAKINDLTIGSLITFESRLYDNIDDVSITNDWDNLDRIIALETFELEVIGIFELLTDLAEEDHFEETLIDGQSVTFPTVEFLRLQQHLNQIYVPINVIEASPSFDFHRASRLEVNGVETLFILYDPLDMPYFLEEANLLLSGYWRMADLSGNFNRITYSMETMSGIADIILIGGLSATVVILGLAMTLFLYDRKHEIGIYLALGEKRKNIIIQILIEVLLITFLSLSLSIFIGDIVASQVSQTMLEHDIVRQIESGENQFWGINNLARYNPGEMSLEEMMANFEVNLDGYSVLLIICIGFITVLFSTFFSLSYLNKISPKKILM